MATILRVPSGDSKGVVTFTTQERDRLINPSGELKERILQLKSRWVTGLHHNWHDFNFRYDPLFDFSLAGEADLVEVNARPFRVIPMDACNFVPPEFAPNQQEKFWDVLFVARAVAFKNIPEFLQAIRSLYDAGHLLRVLFICPIPPVSKQRDRTTIHNIREMYENLFEGAERDLFTLLTLDFNYPFPLDLPTLAHFYGASKIFVHSAADERRCRVAAYAWACGMPVVAMSSVGSVLPERLRKPPLFFEVQSYTDFPSRIREALSSHVPVELVTQARQCLAETETTPQLRRHIEEMADDAPDQRYSLSDLAFRLGRHHEIGMGTNRVRQHLAEFVEILYSTPDSEWGATMQAADPEVALVSNSLWEERHVPEAEERYGSFLKRLVFGVPRRFLRILGRAKPAVMNGR